MATSCYHCGLPVETQNSFTAEITGVHYEFCCFGCQTVCQTIHDSGLSSFYEKSPETKTLLPPPDLPSELTAYDLEEVQAAYVDIDGEDKIIHLLVEGIHCAACVWLIERSLAKQTDVISAEVNLTSKRLRLKWKSTTPLSTLLQLLGNIGYAAVPFDANTAEGALAKRHRSLLYRMAFAGFAMMNLMWISIALYSGADEGEFKNWFHWISFFIATPTLLYAGYPFLRNAVIGLRQRHLTMDLPIAIGATVTYAYSSYVMMAELTQGHVYFDTVVNFLFVILVGRYLEAISKRQALSATTRLLELQPKLATRVAGGETTIVPIRSVNIGDLILVKPGEKIPIDGVIVDGKSAVDESLLTGESQPIVKTISDQVVAGSINGEGAFTVETKQVLRNTALSKIVDLMEDAQASKAPIQCTADKIVPWFVVITLSLAAVTFFYWMQFDFEQALLASISVLIITCPCAFGLATPMSVAVATGVGAKEGILIKQGAALEILSQVTHFVFDKTGTLTEGALKVVTIETATQYSVESILQLAASVESYSEHNIAKALVCKAEQKNINLLAIQHFVSFPGQGVQGEVDGQLILAGTRNWLSTREVAGLEQWDQKLETLENKGISCIYIVLDKQVLGIIGLADQLRSDAKEMVDNLQQQGLSVTILSGDKVSVVTAVTAELGDIQRQAEVMPQDKSELIKRLQRQGEIVAMVGDGVNDAPALIQADVGIALGSGTDVSIESADIVLLQNELYKVIQARYLAQKTLRTIKQNIVLSITYNIIMVPMAVISLVNPLVAAITMPISSLLVIGNAARIKRFFKK